MIEIATVTVRVALRALALCITLSAAAGAATDDRHTRAKSAYDRAAASGDGKHQGYNTAHTLWQELAAEGDARARYHIGILLLFGLGDAEFDQQKGMQDVRAAAEQGYAVAQSLMGLLTERGDGTVARTGDDVALDWWRKGAEGNHCAAVRRLSRAYSNGELGLARDADKAAQWSARENGCMKN